MLGNYEKKNYSGFSRELYMTHDTKPWGHREIMPLDAAVATARVGERRRRSRPSYIVAIRISIVLLHLLESDIELARLSSITLKVQLTFG